MIQIPLITSLTEQLRTLEYDEERRKSHRFEPYVNYLAQIQPMRKARRSIFAAFFQERKASQAASIDFVETLKY